MSIVGWGQSETCYHTLGTGLDNFGHWLDCTGQWDTSLHCLVKASLRFQCPGPWFGRGCLVLDIVTCLWISKGTFPFLILLLLLFRTLYSVSTVQLPESLWWISKRAFMFGWSTFLSKCLIWFAENFCNLFSQSRCNLRFWAAAASQTCRLSWTSGCLLLPSTHSAFHSLAF